MSLGASHFLVSRICLDLQQEGVQDFNLGRRAGKLDTCTIQRGIRMRNNRSSGSGVLCRSAVEEEGTNGDRTGENDRRRLVKLLTGGALFYRVYKEAPEQVPLTIEIPGADFRPLTAEAAQAIEEAEIRQKQLDNYRLMRGAQAYGVWIEDRLAHVSWLLPAEVVNRQQEGILRPLRPDEAEISACETLEAFRGRKLYPFAIQRICRIAAEQGIARLYMKTMLDNKASQAGIEKAGFGSSGGGSTGKSAFVSLSEACGEVAD